MKTKTESIRKAINKFGAFSIGPLVGAVISFITVPLTTHYISADEYGRAGMFALAQSTISTIMYLGMDQAFVREFNAYRDKMGKLLSNAMILPLGVAFISSMLIVLFSKPISKMLFDTNSEIIAVFGLAMLLPFMVLENFSLLTIRMEEKGLVYSFFTILLKTTILGLTIALFLIYEKSFRSVVYAAALSEILNGMLLLLIVLRKQQLSFGFLEKNLIMRMLRFGLPLVPAFAIGWVLTSMDKVMLRTLCSFEELGLYTAAFKIVSVLSIVQTCFTLYWTPVSYRWYENKQSEKTFEIASESVAFIMTMMCLGLLLFKNLVGIILGDNFRNAIAIFPFLLLYPVLYTISETTAVGIGFKRKTGYVILVSALSGGSNVLFNWILIPRWGGVGAAVATGLSYIVFFWGRTMLSRYIWYKMRIGWFFILILIMIANCYIHTFIKGNAPYYVTTISIIALCLLLYSYYRRADISIISKRSTFS